MSLPAAGVVMADLITAQPRGVNGEDFELHDPSNTTLHPVLSHQSATAISSLPPADRGKDAWLFLAAAFVIEGLTWGYAFSFGIFQDYYSGLALFQGQQSRIPIIGTTSTGIMYLSSPVALLLMRNYPHRRRQGMMFGIIISAIAFAAASFAKTATHLIMTQGVLAGVGLSFTYYPVFSFIDEWFVRRKGLAYGIAWAASGFSGLILPYVFSWLLSQYSFRTTLRIWVIVIILLASTALMALKPRLPYTSVVRAYRVRLTFVKDIRFVAFILGNVLVSLGYFLPGIYLPSYARSMGFSSDIATTSLSLLNVGTFLGFVCGGYITDRWSSSSVVCTSTLGTTLAVLFFWGFASNAALLITFAIIYAFFGACFTMTWSGFTRDFLRDDRTRTAEFGTIYGFFISGRGVGNLLSGPLSQALLHLPSLTGSFGFGYGSGFGSLVVFTAVTAVCGGLGPLYEGVSMI